MSSRISDEEIAEAMKIQYPHVCDTDRGVAEAQKKHSDLWWVDRLAVYLTHRNLTLKGLHTLLKEMGNES